MLWMSLYALSVRCIAVPVTTRQAFGVLVTRNMQHVAPRTSVLTEAILLEVSTSGPLVQQCGAHGLLWQTCEHLTGAGGQSRYALSVCALAWKAVAYLARHRALVVVLVVTSVSACRRRLRRRPYSVRAACRTARDEQLITTRTSRRQVDRQERRHVGRGEAAATVPSRRPAFQLIIVTAVVEVPCGWMSDHLGIPLRIADLRHRGD